MIPVPQGFRFAAVKAGFRKEDRPDLGLILSDGPAQVGAVFTKNLFQAAPVLVAKRLLQQRDVFRAVLVNSGQANACTGEQGVADCRQSLELAAAATGLSPSDILPASTGVIGKHMDMDKWANAMPGLSASLGQVDAIAFARSIMTTDAYPKLAWAEVGGGKKDIRILGIAKGAGMIQPNMATMLGFILCDAAVEAKTWQDMLKKAVDLSFNAITVDGDTSTNDTVYALANGAAGFEISRSGRNELQQALNGVCEKLAKLIVADAEGGTTTLRIRVHGAKSDAEAEKAARTVGNSPLVKTAFYGKDANWGRIVAALGRSGAAFDPMDVVLGIAGVTIFRDGEPVRFDFDSVLAAPLRGKEIALDVSLGSGRGEFVLYASDLTHEYVSINADYRS